MNEASEDKADATKDEENQDNLYVGSVGAVETYGFSGYNSLN